MSQVISNPPGGYTDEQIGSCFICAESFQVAGLNARKLAKSHTAKTGHETNVTIIRHLNYIRVG